MHFCRLHNPQGREPPLYKKDNTKIKCIGKTLKGNPCIYYAQTGSQFCGRHDPATKPPLNKKENAKIKCIGKTLKGNPCLYYAQKGSQFCPLHDPATAPPPKRTNQVDYCLAKTARGLRCTNKAKNGTKYCRIHAYYHSPPPGGYSHFGSNYYNWRYFGTSTYGNSYFTPPPPPPPPPVQPNKITEALNYFGLPESTNYNDIKKKYRQFALKHHPDKGGETAIFQKIQDYYSVLGEKYK